MLAADDPVAAEATAAVQSGDLPALRPRLAEHPALATVRTGSGMRLHAPERVAEATGEDGWVLLWSM